jgi:acetyl/propionyl-CoA carboxylase alpha subunit
MVTGLDLVGVQLDVATGGELPADPGIATPRVHAIEARVYAEDATRGFLPQAGDATRVRWPAAPFVRVDAGIESGDVVPVHYDPILAKIIAAAPSRDAALERLAHALDEALVHGVVTNLPFLRALVRANEVARGAIDTEWIEREFLTGFAAVATAPVPELALAAVALVERERGGAPATDGVHSGEPPVLSDPFRAAGPWRMPGLEP